MLKWKVVKYGGSLGLCVTKPMAAILGVEEGDYLDVTIRDDSVTLKAAEKPLIPKVIPKKLTNEPRKPMTF